LRRKAILVAGMPGAGKRTAIEGMSSKGIPVFTMGDVVREEASKMGVKPTPEGLGRVAVELRRRHGPSVIAERMIEKIERSPHVGNLFIVDGVRSLEEVEEFRKHYDTVVVAVHASPKTRFKRLLRRGRSDDPKTWEEFLERDLRELGWGLGSVIATADYMLVNEGSVRELQEAARRIVEEVFGDEG